MPLDSSDTLQRLSSSGPEMMTTEELFAVLLDDVPRDAALELAAQFVESLDTLPDAGRGELRVAIPDLSHSTYCRLMAGVELGRRVQEKKSAHRPIIRIHSTSAAVAFVRDRLSRLVTDGVQEEFHVFTLNTKHHVINGHRVSKGTLDKAIVDPRQVFLPAIRDAARSVLLAHNHVSGDAEPSRQDRTLTNRMKKAGRTVGIEVIDHIIVARNGETSVVEYELGHDSINPYEAA